MRQALGGRKELLHDWITTATVIRETEVFLCHMDSGQMIRRPGGGTRKYRRNLRDKADGPHNEDLGKSSARVAKRRRSDL